MTPNHMSHYQPIHVVIDHQDAVVSAGLHALLAGFADLLLNDASDCPAPVDVFITDYQSGLARCNVSLYGRGRKPPVLILTHRDTDWDVHLAVAAGVRGYLLHSDGSAQLERAIRAVAGGIRFMSPLVAQDEAGLSQAVNLSKRQNEVLMLLAEGCCNKMIARELNIEVGTVKSHLKGLFTKLGATARSHAVALGVRQGLIQYDGRGRLSQSYDLPRR
jgi:two-component system NarL family response regulator